MEIESIRRIEVRPGDKVVVRVPGSISNESAHRIRDYVAKALGCSEVLVLGDGMNLEILSPVV